MKHSRSSFLSLTVCSCSAKFLAVQNLHLQTLPGLDDSKTDSEFPQKNKNKIEEMKKSSNGCLS